MSARRKHSYEFDAALSFAGEDRAHAEAFARKLQARGLKVFYDKDHQHRLWGKGQSEYEHIYGPASRYVIPFISKHYVKKDWTRLEFEFAKRGARSRSGEFLLPVRIDDSSLLGLHDDRGFLSLTDSFQDR